MDAREDNPHFECWHCGWTPRSQGAHLCTCFTCGWQPGGGDTHHLCTEEMVHAYMIKLARDGDRGRAILDLRTWTRRQSCHQLRRLILAHHANEVAEQACGRRGRRGDVFSLKGSAFRQSLRNQQPNVKEKIKWNLETIEMTKPGVPPPGPVST